MADTISGLVSRWATQTPRAPAIQCGSRVLTYYDLHRAAANVACRLSHSMAPGRLIAVPAERTAETACVILGILQAGCVYLPIDTADTTGRAEQVLAQAAPDLILTSAHVLRPFDEVLSPPPVGPAANDLAYVMPTSGTNGSVKLVEVPHAAVCHNLRALAAAIGGISPQDRYLHTASFAFSSSVRQLFLPLSSGALSVIAAGDQRVDPHALLELARRARITVLDTIPSFLSVLADGLETGYGRENGSVTDASLRLLLLASEPLPSMLVRRWRAVADAAGTVIYNMYGQTETAGIVSIHRVDDPPAEGTVPIGHALPGSTLSLLGPDGVSAETGLACEIAVTGPGLAVGYRGDRELTAARFPAGHARRGGQPAYLTGDLATRENGVLTFAGRTDKLVKVRGHHVDLTRVEQELEQHPAVAEAAAFVAQGRDGTPTLRVCARLIYGYLDRQTEDRLRQLPNGLRVIDLDRAETDHMYEEIFTRQVYNQHGIVVPKGALVIDAGANIGLFSLAIATGHPSARVIAFEPAAPTAAVLRANLRANDCANVSVRVQGLSDHTGTATLTWYRHASGLSSFHPSHHDEHATLMSIVAHHTAHGSIPPGHELTEQASDMADAKLASEQLPCALARLSDILDVEGIGTVDLLKIDVQKSEFEVLAGIDDRHWPRIMQITAEVHDIDGRLDQMCQHLAERGYKVTTGQDPVLAAPGLYYVYARLESAQHPAAPVAHTQATPAPRSHGSVSAQDLTIFLAARLDSHHIPEAVAILDDFQRTASGKIDRARLADQVPQLAPDPPAGREEPTDPMVTGIAATWQEVLGKPVTSHDDFFDLGGSSLSAARVTARIRQRFGAPGISIRTIFEDSRLDRYTAAIKSQLRTLPTDNHTN